MENSHWIGNQPSFIANKLPAYFGYVYSRCTKSWNISSTAVFYPTLREITSSLTANTAFGSADHEGPKSSLPSMIWPDDWMTSSRFVPYCWTSPKPSAVSLTKGSYLSWSTMGYGKHHLLSRRHPFCQNPRGHHRRFKVRTLPSYIRCPLRHGLVSTPIPGLFKRHAKLCQIGD